MKIATDYRPLAADYRPLAAIVCGFERGGTTLISEILRQHPMLYSGFEGGFLIVDKISDFLSLEPYCTNFKRGWKIDDSDLKYICEAYSWLEVYRRVVERSPIIERKDGWIFDKTPRYLRFLSDVLRKVPNVPCVVIVRDPRALLWSWAKRSDLSIEEWLNRKLEPSCAAYMSYANGLKKAIDEGFGSRLLLVHYENLCINTAVEVERIFKFIGMNFNMSSSFFEKAPMFPNVYGNEISTRYLEEYKSNLPEEACQKILKLTESVREWSWKWDKVDNSMNWRSNLEPSPKEVTKNTPLEIIDVVRLSQRNSDFLVDFAIDSPKKANKINPQELHVTGWVLGKYSLAVEVELSSGNRVLQITPIEKQRPDVAKAFPKFTRAEKCGFATDIDVSGLEENRLALTAVLKNQTRIPIGEVQFRSIWQKSSDTAKVNNFLNETNQPHNKESSVKEKILLSSPRPLFSNEHKLALFWSAKSGCTFAVKWFFYQIGFLKAALDYDPWVHKFRKEVFESSEDYQKHIFQILNTETNTIKLVRNPYSRAVSSYIHALRWGYEDKQIGQFLARLVNQQERFSFREFVAYLGSRDLWHCNIHHKIQMHQSEKKKLLEPNYIVKLENSFDEIPKIEESLGLLRSDLKSLAQSNHHTAKHSDSGNLCADECFDIYKKRMRVIPPTICFYDSALKKEVANLYGVDFEAYKYDIDLIP